MSLSSVPQLAAATNQFSLELYHNIIASKSPGQNIFFSPFSITAALAMVTIGSNGATRNQMLDSLQLTNDFSNLDKLNNAFNQTLTILNVPTATNKSPLNNIETIPSSPNSTFQFDLANKIYLQKGFKIKEAFAKSLESYYHSSFGSADFARNSEAACKDINRWVEKVTNNKINNLFKDLEPDTQLVVVSAVYFKSTWKKLFDPKKTVEKDFFLSNGETIVTKFMNIMASYSIATFKQLDSKAILLPYTNTDFHLIIILPNDKNGLQKLEAAITRDVFDVTNYINNPVRLSLPKFKVEDRYDLVDILTKLGIRDVFTSEANLTGISDQALSVSGVLHKAFVEVDEKGTEAAAATGISMRLRSAGPIGQRQFNANHPFLFAVQHKTTGLVMFLGKIEKPL